MPTSKIFANSETWLQLQKWGYNSSDVWLHPLTSGQLPGIKYGDELIFRNTSTSEEKKVRVIGVYEGEEFKNFTRTFGEIKYGDWAFVRALKVEVIR